MTRTTGLLALVAACLAAPAAAEADSIVYSNGNNVWVANPDGSGRHQVTRDGTAGLPYHSPSQADDGIIVAGHGDHVVRLRQNGTLLSSFDPPDTTDSAGQPAGGRPRSIAVSPDGEKVAFVYSGYNCPAGASCGARAVLLYSHADRATTVSEMGRLFLRNPSWVSNDRILAFGGYQRQVNFDDPDGGTDDQEHWFDDEDLFDPSTDLGDGELSRQGDRFAAIRGFGDSTHLMIYRVGAGAPPAPPTYACNTGVEPTLAGPSWSPDGRRIAFQHSEGIEVLPLPSVEDGCPGASSGTVVIPGGSEPDWGPAPVNPGPPVTAPSNLGSPVTAPSNPPAGDTGAQPCASSCGGMGVQPRLAVMRPRRVGLRAARRRGILLRVKPPGAGRLTASARTGRRKVGSGRATVNAAGKANVRVRFSRRGLRELRRGRRIAFRVSFRPRGGGAVQTANATVRLGR